jgi:peptide/nickel transport system permease protein
LHFVTADYFLKRLALFFAVALMAATVNFFFIPAAMRPGGESVGLSQIYRARFGVERPLWRQYLNYLGDTARLDFGKSRANYPTPVISMLRAAIPWSIGLLGTATVISFVLGSLGGALMGWGKAPRWLRTIFPVFFTFSAVPFYLMGMILLYIFAFRNYWLPLFGGYNVQSVPEFTLAFWADVLKHAILPAASIVLAQIGFWALGMRSMMVNMQGEDYMRQAEAKGLSGPRIFFRYAMRNALLPQTTQLAVTLGHVISGAILVEIVFSYPGVGTVMLNAIRTFDYFVLQGVIFTIIITVALAMLIIDLVYPLLDPRINYKKA